ncbi:TetR/AcrR family transcriptional regulator [Zavarzinia sp. CC-PAN008]|uniref:TetR/AcrR family transcriptional regulator n=1 Tax=Zavarzinia sp. CC-PAN008 TaxID=3243332 RepID=UPI003F7487C0
MARPRDAGRLARIADAALGVFGRSGFRLAQMADVARACGLSPGTLYLSVDSKEALLHIAVRHALGRLDDGYAATGQATGLDATIALLREAMGGAGTRWPLLRTAVTAPPPSDAAAELAAIIGEIHEQLSAQRRLIWLLDHCGRDLPALGAFLATAMRGGLLADLEAYARARVAQGLFDPIAVRPGTSRAIVEQVSWLAMHRHADADPPPLDDAAARRLTQDLACATLLRKRAP